ncbi:hypothetical protein C7C46_14985 [Streptomyces tateyamensis]|uniref:ABC transporter permease n=1 Tax=Streptomyces tateyamensis TaxID=565073 RepID=A0A2V4N4T9_9ACTN|nr:hypothetical protein [Streptomyces tateyamensis]PYC79165.1 hypothetical protein C7C46_14985 [Streptomyces tateyamensis]
MFYLRLVRGYRVVDLGRWLLTSVAAAVVAAFLLRALGRALSDPPGAHSAPERLLWCLPPLLAVAWFAAVAARALPAQRAERIAGLRAAGAGPVRLRLLIAGEIALACAAGAVVSLLLFLVLRNNIAGPGLAPELGMGDPLPPAAPVALVALLPLVGGVAAVCAVPGRDALPQTRPAVTAAPFGLPRILLAGLLTFGGTLTELYALRPAAAEDPRPLQLPADLGHTNALLLGGWAAATLGAALLTGPLLAGVGRLLALGRPGARRLLAGRGLAALAPRLGTPLAVLALTLAVVLTAVRHWVAPGASGTGPLPAAEALLVIGCASAAVVARLTELRAARRPVGAALLRLGAAPRLLAAATLLRWALAGLVLLATGGLTAVLGAALLT